MARVILSIAILSLLFGSGIAAQNIDLPSPGLTPDSPFYFFDTLAEKISLLFTFDTVKKAEKAFQYTGEKLAEVKVMAGANKIEALKKAGQKYQEYLSLFFKKGGKASEEGKDVKELERISKSKSIDYLRVLADTQEESLVEAKTEVEKIIKVSRESFGETIWSVHEERMEELREEKIREELKKQIEMLEKEGIEAPEKVIKVETTYWNVYRNEKFGFAIKYPQDWKTKERSLMSDLGHRDFVWIQNNGDEFSVDVWDFSFYSYDQLTEPPPGGIDPDTIEKKEIIIDNQPATELSYVAVGDGGSGAKRVREVFIQKNQLLYKIRSIDSKKCDQILSTFGFVK